MPSKTKKADKPAEKKEPQRTCSECNHPMVRCDKNGKRVHGGGYFVCPNALREHDPSEFAKPWQARKHREARIEETPETTRMRRSAAKLAGTPLLFDDPNVGKRQTA